MMNFQGIFVDKNGIFRAVAEPVGTAAELRTVLTASTSPSRMEIRTVTRRTRWQSGGQGGGAASWVAQGTRGARYIFCVIYFCVHTYIFR